MCNPVKTFVIDLFCGAGGTSTAIFKSATNIEVVACVNHDENAIRSHHANYPSCIHFIEDIRKLNLGPLQKLILKLRRLYPGCKIALWASLECTNFSKAKSGPKNPDSRTLAEHLFRYFELGLDFLWIENVEEFLDWGPLDQNDNPDNSRKGESFNCWLNDILDHFPYCTWDVYTSADYGGYTIRKRLFIQFSKDGVLAIPKKTHSKSGDALLPWLGVREVLDLDDFGESIFTKKKNLVENTHKRIYKGLSKFKIIKPEQNHPTPVFLKQNYGTSFGQNISDPAWALTKNNKADVVFAHVIQSSIKPIFLNIDFSQSTGSSLQQPSPTLVGNNKLSLVSGAFVVNSQFGGQVRSVEVPITTLTGRNDPPNLVHVNPFLNFNRIRKEKIYRKSNRKIRNHIRVDKSGITYFYYEDDDIYLSKIKDFMYAQGIFDILIRPLKIREMLKIQGFPKDYKLLGTQTEQRKYIGNSVEVCVGVALFQAIDKAIQKAYQ